ncbi:MAG: nucleotidyl transferase AbiEii/AbiGii toxin family protein [Leptospirales bacterium]
MSNKKALDNDTKQNVAQTVQILILDAMSRNTSWTVNDIVFQGGTSLSLAYRSPRFSEDLDFIVSKDLAFPKELSRISSYVCDGLQTSFPGSVVRLSEEKTERNPLHLFMFAIDLPGTHGSVHVKTEFYKVEPDLVRGYDGEYRTLFGKMNISPLFSVATTKQIFVDKMFAIGNRGFIKWRDLFDVWWLESHSGLSVDRIASFPEMFDRCAALYQKVPSDAAPGLIRFIDTQTSDLVLLAEKDLKPWISENLWERFYPDVVRKMVETSKKNCETVLDMIDGGKFGKPLVIRRERPEEDSDAFSGPGF